MYAIIDKRSSAEIKKNLSKYVDDIFEFSSVGITYNAIAGHPDIFIYQDVANRLIIAPNSPHDLINFLSKKNVPYAFGKATVGKSLDQSVLYNCLATDTYFFCKQGKPDRLIEELNSTKKLIDLPQAYSRCSMFAIENHIITSDKGIVKVLENHLIDYCYFDPSTITIEDHKNGFIGGTMGMYEDKVFFLGNILKHQDGKVLERFITNLNREIICLGNDELYDGGSIFFIS